MPVKTYLWIEDRKGKSGYTFWETLTKQLCPDVIVESKKNNSELVKAVRALADKENRYMIVYDNSFDNIQVYMERRALKKLVDDRENVYLVDLICFEYTLLEFDGLIDWIYAPEDPLLDRRAGVVKAREKLLEALSTGDTNYKALKEVMEYDKNVDDHNIEQLSAKLLFDLTRNTGFEISKGTIGDCWIRSCCGRAERQEDDRCGLEYAGLSVAEKMRRIYVGTSICREFSKIGMEVSL